MYTKKSFEPWLWLFLVFDNVCWNGFRSSECYLYGLLYQIDMENSCFLIIYVKNKQSIVFLDPLYSTTLNRVGVIAPIVQALFLGGSETTVQGL